MAKMSLGPLADAGPPFGGRPTRENRENIVFLKKIGQILLILEGHGPVPPPPSAFASADTGGLKGFSPPSHFGGKLRRAQRASRYAFFNFPPPPLSLPDVSLNPLPVLGHRRASGQGNVVLCSLLHTSTGRVQCPELTKARERASSRLAAQHCNGRPGRAPRAGGRECRGLCRDTTPYPPKHWAAQTQRITLKQNARTCMLTHHCQANNINAAVSFLREPCGWSSVTR